MKTTRFAAAVLALASACAWADSSTSSASSAASQSVGSLSNSLSSSSKSSEGEDKVAQGEYTVVRVAAAQQPGHTTLVLQGPDQIELKLQLPEGTRQQAGVQAGDVVRVAQRSYGWQFSRAGQAEPFYLVVRDRYQHEMNTRML
ncbi:hypothetical protein ACG0Z6_05905 [Roseateles sp. BYS180W]|uniref:Lipoprotein n=1 Tax=Roseateles rivi TaxID=3299028 RepID=A0ABW7FU14_9BURK